MRTLTDAGRLSVPFTTGLLVGIGETLAERAETIHAIRKSQGIPVISRKSSCRTSGPRITPPWRRPDDAGIDDFLATIAVTRLVLGPAMRVQAPPNLVSRARYLALIGAGVDDWGGVFR